VATKSKYLIERGKGFAFRMAIPRPLRGKFKSSKGKPLFHVTIGLSTDSEREAQAKAIVLEHQWRQAFDRARRGSPLSPAEIEEAARETYQAMLEAMAALPPAEQDLNAAIGVLEDDIEGEEWEEASRTIEAIERRKGVKIEKDSATYAALAGAILTARLEAMYGRQRAMRGLPSEPPAAFTSQGIDPLTLQPAARAAPVLRSVRGGVGFPEVSERFLDELQRDPGTKRREQSFRQYKNAFRLFADYVNNAPLVAIDRKTAAGFLDTVAKLDPKWGQTPKSKGLPLNALLAQFGRGKGQLSNAALNHYASALKSLFDWARKRGDFEGENPFAEQSRKLADPRKAGWSPYAVDELNKLFGSKLFTDTSAAQRLRANKHSIETTMRWVPLVALYSGMRLEEICQLQTSDVKHDSGVWYFNVTSEGEGQKLKSEAATRRLPVHPELIRCGFLRYLKSLPVGPLWPGLKRGGPDKKLSFYFSKRFTAYRRAVKIEGARKSFHSLRKNFTTALDEAGVHQADAAMLLGHARGFTFDHYSGGKGLQTLKGIVERVDYPGLNLTHLHID
jgi:integrase